MLDRRGRKPAVPGGGNPKAVSLEAADDANVRQPAGATAAENESDRLRRTDTYSAASRTTVVL